MPTDLLERPASPTRPQTSGSRSLLRSRIEDQIRGRAGRERILRVLSEMARDAFNCEPADAAWASMPAIVEALNDPVAAAAETAVDTLVDKLATAVDLIPDAALDAWERLRRRADLGLE